MCKLGGSTFHSLPFYISMNIISKYGRSTLDWLPLEGHTVITGCLC